MTERPSFVRHGLFIYRPLTTENTKSFAHCFNVNKHRVEENAANPGEPVPYFKNMDSNLAGKILETRGKRGLTVYGNLSHYKFLLRNWLTGETEETDFSKLIAKSRMIAQSLQYDNITIDTDIKKIIENIDSLRTDKILIPVDVRCKFKIPVKFNVDSPKSEDMRARQQLCNKLGSTLRKISKESGTSINRQKIYIENSETFGEYIMRYNLVCQKNADYSNLNFSKLDNIMENKMGKALGRLFNLGHKIAFQELKSSVPEHFFNFKLGARPIDVNEETIEKFSKTPEEYAREAIDKKQNMIRVWDKKLHKYVDSEATQEMIESSFEKEKQAFDKVLNENPLLKKYVEKKWEKLKEAKKEISISRDSDFELTR